MDIGSTKLIDSVVSSDKALINQVLPDEEELKNGRQAQLLIGTSLCVMTTSAEDRRFHTRRQLNGNNQLLVSGGNEIDLHQEIKPK